MRLLSFVSYLISGFILQKQIFVVLWECNEIKIGMVFCSRKNILFCKLTKMLYVFAIHGLYYKDKITLQTLYFTVHYQFTAHRS